MLNRETLSNWVNVGSVGKNKYSQRKKESTKTIGHSIDKLTLIVDEYLLEQLQYTSKLFVVVDGKLLSQKSHEFPSNLTKGSVAAHVRLYSRFISVSIFFLSWIIWIKIFLKYEIKSKILKTPHTHTCLFVFSISAKKSSKSYFLLKFDLVLVFI